MARVGLVAKLDPACRLLSLALLSSASLYSGLPLVGLLALALLGFLINGRVPIPTLVRDAAFISLFAICTGALRFVGSGGEFWPNLSSVAAYGLRLLAAFLAGKLFYASTSVSEFRDAATRIARRLPLVRRFDVGLALSMVIGFVPLIFDEWRASVEAARSRGLPQRPRLSQQAPLVAAFLRRLMLRAVSLPEALSARGWTNARGIAPSRWRVRDSVVALACVGLALCATFRIV